MLRTACLWFVLLAGRGEAMQVDLPPCALYHLSSVVLLGEVSSQEARWTSGGDGGIETVVDVWLIDAWKGTVETEWVEVALPGGEIGDLGQFVEDVPSLWNGRSYVFFLVRSAQGTWTVAGGERGAVPVPRSPDADASLQALRSALEACDAP